MAYCLVIIDQSDESEDAALILHERCIPCILHMKNCIREKILTMLFLRTNEKSYKDRVSMKSFSKRIIDERNSSMFGTENSPAQWKFPLTEAGGKLGRYLVQIHM